MKTKFTAEELEAYPKWVKDVFQMFDENITVLHDKLIELLDHWKIDAKQFSSLHGELSGQILMLKIFYLIVILGDKKRSEQLSKVRHCKDLLRITEGTQEPRWNVARKHLQIIIEQIPKPIKSSFREKVLSDVKRQQNLVTE